MTNKGLVIKLDNLAKVEYLTENQAAFGIRYGSYDVHLLHGVAGTGKSFLALYRALYDVLDKNTIYKKIIILRSAVGSRDIGFLPGDEEEKSAVYQAPYQQLCKDLLGRYDAYTRLKEQRVLDFMLSSFVRGTTYDRTIIIVDEIQNLSYNELYAIITRVGIDSKILFCGDTRQIDLRSKKDIDKFMKVLDNMPSVNRIEFGVDDIVRSDIVKEFIIAEDRLYGN